MSNKYLSATHLGGLLSHLWLRSYQQPPQNFTLFLNPCQLLVSCVCQCVCGCGCVWVWVWVCIYVCVSARVSVGVSMCLSVCVNVQCVYGVYIYECVWMCGGGKCVMWVCVNVLVCVSVLVYGEGGLWCVGVVWMCALQSLNCKTRKHFWVQVGSVNSNVDNPNSRIIWIRTEISHISPMLICLLNSKFSKSLVCQFRINRYPPVSPSHACMTPPQKKVLGVVIHQRTRDWPFLVQRTI